MSTTSSSDATPVPPTPAQTLTINGRACTFQPGQNVLQVALDHEIEIPHYCYHPSLSVVANCRICLAEVWQPNPRTGALEPLPKLVPTCQTPAAPGQVIYTDSPKAIANQKSVMEYLLINHPVDCPVCDQAGECHLQDYSYQYGRGQARFREQKIKQPKKDIGPHVLLYSDRCIMCTRCVRFTHEITGTKELMVDGRGAMEQIDVFPGIALDNELSGNVIDLCPVGALLDKDFLFQQRVWLLKKTPSIDGITASGDNISIEHNDGRVYRIKPRVNPEVNRFWITDEVRYGWKFVHDEARLRMPVLRGEESMPSEEAPLAWESSLDRVLDRLGASRRILLMASPMLSCEDVWLLAEALRACSTAAIDAAVGPVLRVGEDRVFRDGFRLCAEKAPNARGVRRVLGAFGDRGFSPVMEFDAAVAALGRGGHDLVVLTGNYPSAWATGDLLGAIPGAAFVTLLDTLPGRLLARADVLLPCATWVEKAGTFENHDGRLQAFERAIAPIDYVKSEAQIAVDLVARQRGERPRAYNPAQVRQRMSVESGLEAMIGVAAIRSLEPVIESDMELIPL